MISGNSLELIVTVKETETSVNLTQITAIIALIAPILVAIINNIHNARMKKWDIEREDNNFRREFVLESMQETFNELFEVAGRFIANHDKSENIEALLGVILKARRFEDNTLKGKLDELEIYVEAYLPECQNQGEIKSVIDAVKDVSKYVNELLKQE